MQVGNAVIDNYYDDIGKVEYWWGHSLISDHTYKLIKKACNFRKPSQKCYDALDYAEYHELGSIDQYSIYTPTCTASQKRPRRPLRFKNALARLRFSGYDPCTEYYAETYYNRHDVQKALHANTTGIPYSWTLCRYLPLALFPMLYSRL